MTLTSLPERLLNRPLSQFPSLWTSLLNGDLLSLADETALRDVRIYEDNNQLHVEVPLPGLNLNEIDVSLNKGVLLIKGESKEEEKDSKKKFYRTSQRNYFYSIALPTQTDEKAEPKAEYTDGILNISLQLSKQAETKKIAVKAGKK